MKRCTLRDFVRESNRIEGIVRVTEREMAVHERFLALRHVNVDDLVDFVAIVADAPLRAAKDMDVRVGDHYPPPGGPDVVVELRELLAQVNARAFAPDLPPARDTLVPFLTHCRYETLHPFMDGNGRSGRALWLWQMGGIRHAPLGFLHHFYYQTLDARK